VQNTQPSLPITDDTHAEHNYRQEHWSGNSNVRKLYSSHIIHRLMTTMCIELHRTGRQVCCNCKLIGNYTKLKMQCKQDMNLAWITTSYSRSSQGPKTVYFCWRTTKAKDNIPGQSSLIYRQNNFGTLVSTAETADRAFMLGTLCNMTWTRT